LGCNKNSGGLFWFSAEDESLISQSTLYGVDYEDDDIEEPEIRVIAEDVASPHSLVVDDDEEGKVYFFIG